MKGILASIGQFILDHVWGIITGIFFITALGLFFRLLNDLITKDLKFMFNLSETQINNIYNLIDIYGDISEIPAIVSIGALICRWFYKKAFKN